MDTNMHDQSQTLYLEIRGESQRHFRSILMWANVIGIFIIVFGTILGISSIMAVFGLSALSSMGSDDTINPFAGLGSFVFGILGLLFTALYIYLGYCLYNFARKGRQALRTKEQFMLDWSMRSFAKYWTITGILVSIAAVIYGLIFIFSIVGVIVASI